MHVMPEETIIPANSLSRRRLLRQGCIVLAGWSLANRVEGALRPGDPGVRFGVRGPFKGTNLRERALLLKRLGYQGIELGPEYLDKLQSHRLTRYLVKRLESLGHEVTLTPVEQAA